MFLKIRPESQCDLLAWLSYLPVVRNTVSELTCFAVFALATWETVVKKPNYKSYGRIPGVFFNICWKKNPIPKIKTTENTDDYRATNNAMYI